MNKGMRKFIVFVVPFMLQKGFDHQSLHVLLHCVPHHIKGTLCSFASNLVTMRSLVINHVNLNVSWLLHIWKIHLCTISKFKFNSYDLIERQYP